jgi:triacylglycerol lipase
MRYKRFGALGLVLALAGGTVSCTTPTPPTPRTPVMFVHGYGGTAEYWTGVKAQFVTAGYTPAELGAVTYDFNVAIDVSARVLEQGVADLLASTGASKVDIVSYSQGSLVAKDCIIAFGCRDKVSHWMSIAGVDNGTTVELPTAKGTASNEDVQGRTPLIRNLQARWSELVAQGVKVEVQWTPIDLIVDPSDRSKEPAPATDKVVPGTNHLLIANDPRVVAESLVFLTS